VNPDGTITTDQTVVYTPNEVTADVTIPSNLGPQTVPGVTGKTGETVDVPVPAVAGYTPDQSTVPATVNPDGTITTDQTVVYTPNEVTANVTIPSNLGPQIVLGVTGKTGETVDVTVPTVAGYTPDQSTVPATVNPDGTITTDRTVVYTPNEVTADVTIPSNLGPQIVPGVTGKTGETVDVTVPAVAGYTPDQSTVPATVNPDGTITTDRTVVYTPNEVTADVTIPSNLGPQIVPGVTGKTGETVDVTVPAVAGYTPDQSTVPATVNPDGTITTDQTVVYTPNEVTADVTIPSNLGPQIVPGVTGKTGETVDVTVPEVTGYTPDQTTVPATVNPDGTITTDQTVVYTPNEVTANVTIPSNLGPQTVPGVTGKTGETVDVPVPAVVGYTPDQSTVPATVNPDGTITTDQTVVYTPNEVTTDVTIPSNLGPQMVPGVTGKTGETVDVTVPAVAGYTPDQTTVPATVNPDGTITTDQTVVYTPNEVTADVTIPSNLGPQTVPGVTGKTGETVDVPVPAVAGYTPDQSTVPATVNPDGTITTDQTVVYTPNEVTANVTIPSNLGPQIVPGVTGKTGETVDVTVPAVAGYTPDQSTVPATVNPDGTITTTQQVTYTPNPVAPDQDHNVTGAPESAQSGQTAPAQSQTETTGATQSETTPIVATQTATDTVQTVVQTTTGTPNLAPALTAREQALTTTNGTDKLPTSQTATTLPQTNDANSVWLAAVGLALVGFAGFLVAFKPRRPQD
jgi:LPXTG-motif cell wall-anchored protein